MNKKNIIYGLTCPDTGFVRYIGKSMVGLKRPLRHKNKHGLIAKSHKNNWINSLISQGKMYGIKIIEENIKVEDLSSREVYWIARYLETGHSLTNSTIGGEGTPGMKLTDETKQKMSQKRSEYLKKNPEVLKQIQTLNLIPNIEQDGKILKNCSDCKTYIDINNYHKDKNRRDGLRTICKSCALIRKNKYYSDNITKLTPEQMKISYESRKAAMSKGVSQSYANNPELRVKLSQARSKPILRVDPLTNQTKEYKSALNAKEDGFQNSNIGVAIKKKALYKGYYWKFK